MGIAARVLGCGSALLGVLLVTRSPGGIAGGVVWLPKLWAQAWAPLIAGVAAVGALIGLARRDAGPLVGGVFGVIAAVRYTARVTAGHDGFAVAFGPGWQDRIPEGLQAHLPRSRYRPLQPAPPNAPRQADVVVGNRRDGRPLLADLWRPPVGVLPTELAVIFLHGSLWQALDKDFLTRPLFRRIAGQGHTVLDLAYPLAPDADLEEMVEAVHGAIGWLREHAQAYGVRPDRIVLMGSSGGAHLALLAAYTADRSAPPVRGVVSLFGMTDLAAFFAEYGRSNPAQPHSSAGITKAMRPRIHDRTFLDRALTRARIFPAYRHGNMPGGPMALIDLLGGTPNEMPDAYRLGSPIAHVRPGCPPTLQILGDDDFVVEVSHARRLHARLGEAGVPSIIVELPDTVHGFDQYFGVSRRVAPAAQAATYDIERFLALMV